MYVLVFDSSDYESTEYAILTCHENEQVLQTLADEGNALAERLYVAIRAKNEAVQKAMEAIPYPKSPKVDFTKTDQNRVAVYRKLVEQCIARRNEVIKQLEEQYVLSDPELKRQYDRDRSGQGRYYVQKSTFDAPQLF